MNKKSLAVWLGLATLAMMPLSGSAVTYVGAHPDDIEIFMGKDLMRDIAGQVNLNLVVMTAGDAGNNLTASASNTTRMNYAGKVYPKVRLDAHQAAVTYAMTISGTGDYIAPNQIVTTNETYAGKRIQVITITYPNSTRRVRLFNLMLPDGNTPGTGFPLNNYQSLTKLYNGSLAKINSLDANRNTYTKPELVATIKDIIEKNETTGARFHVKIPQTDRTINVKSHEDHLHAGMFTELAMADMKCAVKYRFTDYVNNTLPATILSADDREKLWGLYGALNSYLVTNGNRNTVNSVHNAWIGRQGYTYTNGTCGY